jgi:hypothetical protein
MPRLPLLVLFLVPTAFSGLLGAAEEPRTEEKGTFLGVLVRPNTDARNESNPVVGPARPQGVCITHVVPDSPAARAHLRRNDVLLQYDGEVIRDGDHLAHLIRNDRPDRKVKLRLLRESREQTAEVTLTLGPPLTIAPGVRKSGGSSDEPAGVAKPGDRTPAAVCVVVTPLEEGKVRVTIESSATGKVQTITCTRTTDIDHVVEGLSERERNLVRIALQRLRTTIQATPPTKR